MVTKRIFLGDTEETLLLCGEQDSNLKNIEKKLGVQIFARSSTLAIRGNPRKVDQAIASLEDLRNQIRSKRVEGNNQQWHLNLERNEFSPGTQKKWDLYAKMTKQNISNSTVQDEVIYTSVTGKAITPISPQQKKYVQAVTQYDMVMAVGPAGTGKTFLAVVCALNFLHSGKVQRIILTRPVVEAGEKLGFLPGDLNEKVNPYLRPLYDAFQILLGPERSRIYREDETIEIVPLAYMRGRTLENCFVILDEAQNTTPQQMKMFLTRMGKNSKMVITGDVTQIDLEDKQVSGYVQGLKVLKNIPEIQVIHFSEQDVVRHNLVRKILKAYDDFEEKKSG